jgi:protein-S-isoprenylcysteine O-methyltransferase Ste14
MTSQLAYLVFVSVWWVLAAAALFTYLLSGNAPPKRQAGMTANLLVIVPFALVTILFYLGRYGGVYHGNEVTRTAGGLTAGAGLAGYLLSHLYLRRNWSLAASVRQGQRLVTSGPYRLVRHPMYSSMTAIVLGSGLLTDNYLIVAATIVVGMVYYVRAGREEDLLRQEFPEFEQYASKVTMFIPFVF